MIRNTFSYLYSLLLVVADFVTILSAFVIAYIVRVKIDNRPLVVDIPAREFLMVFLLLVPIWLLIFALLGLYNQDIYKKRVREFINLCLGSALAVLTLIAYDWGTNKAIFPARLVPVYALNLSVLLLYIERAIMAGVRKQLLHYGHGISRTVIIGNSPMTTELINQLDEPRNSGYEITAIYAPSKLVPASLKAIRLKSVPAALRYLRSHNVHVVIQTERFEDPHITQQIIDVSQERHIAYKFVPTEQGVLANNIHVDLLANIPVVSVYQTPLIGWGRIAKRLFDITLASLGLLAALPIYLIVGVIIKLTDWRGPIFYQHERVSRFGTMFKAYKLRSMYWRYSSGKKSDTEIFKEMGREDLVAEWEEYQKIQTDPRIMPIGRFIRRTSLDELPQLWNVLKGELSLVGPRPVTKSELKRYARHSSLFLSVKPGITGLWQVSGRSQNTYDERISLDLFYIQNWSFMMDLKIIYRTVLVMLGGKGV